MSVAGRDAGTTVARSARLNLSPLAVDKGLSLASGWVISQTFGATSAELDTYYAAFGCPMGFQHRRQASP